MNRVMVDEESPLDSASYYGHSSLVVVVVLDMGGSLLGSHPYSLHPNQQQDLRKTSVFGPFTWCIGMDGFVGVGLLGYCQLTILVGILL